MNDSTGHSAPTLCPSGALENILAFLREHALPDLAERIDDSMELQANMSGDGGVQNPRKKTGNWITEDGLEEWGNLRVPRDAATKPHFEDYTLRFDFAEHVAEIGSTGWDWRNLRSRWVGFDFDSIVNHKAGLTPEALQGVLEAVQSLPYVEIRRSTSGTGYHLYVHVDAPAQNHTEHAALAKVVLTQMSRDSGVDLSDSVDVCGGNMWIWSRRATPENQGLTLVKAATEDFTLPPDWQPAPAQAKSTTPDMWAELASAGDMTVDALRGQLDRWGVAYQETTKGDSVQFNLAVCPLCKESEGNPAVWLNSGVACFKCHRAQHCDKSPKKTFADLKAHFEPKRTGLVPIKASELVEQYRTPRPCIVKGLIRKGDVVNIVGGSKSRKSFFVMQLALSIANGVPFLGWETVKGRVLLIDNELHPTDLSQRLRAMAAKTGLSLEGVALLPLRGKLADLNTIRDLITGFDEPFALVVLDAWYKLLPAGMDENSNSDVTQMYVALDETAEQSGSAIGVVHHTSKGSQANKSVSDMGSGAGAQSRSADLHLVLRNHEEADTVVLQAVVRAQAPVEPKCLVFEHPVWVVAPEKNPDRLAVVNKREPVTVAQFVETIPTTPEPKMDVLRASKAKLRVTKDEWHLLLSTAEKEGLVEVAKPSNKKFPHTIQRIKA